MHQYDIVLDVTVVNRSPATLQNLNLELATMGDLKLVERPQNHTLGPGASKTIRANIKARWTCWRAWPLCADRDRKSYSPILYRMSSASGNWWRRRPRRQILPRQHEGMQETLARLSHSVCQRSELDQHVSCRCHPRRLVPSSATSCTRALARWTAR